MAAAPPNLAQITDDPIIPFRVSHALTIQRTKDTVETMLRVGAFVGTSVVVLLAAVLGAILMK